MKPAPIPANEAARQARLERLGVLDTLPQPAFDHITEIAANICGTPVALISLVDRERQWFKSRVGLETSQTSREASFCGHAILEPEQLLVVEDTSRDQRFADNPLVLGDPRIRFYAGAPIVTDDGYALGTVCVIDQRPRVLQADQRAALRALASLVSTLLEHERLHREEAQRNSTAARRREQIFQALLHGGRELLSFVDAHYVYQFVNPTYSAYWQRKPEDIVGRRVIDLAGEERFLDTIKPLIDRALAGEAVQYETAFLFPGVGRRQVEVSYLPACDDAGRCWAWWCGCSTYRRARNAKTRSSRHSTACSTKRWRKSVSFTSSRTICANPSTPSTTLPACWPTTRRLTLSPAGTWISCARADAAWRRCSTDCLISCASISGP